MANFETKFDLNVKIVMLLDGAGMLKLIGNMEYRLFFVLQFLILTSLTLEKSAFAFMENQTPDSEHEVAGLYYGVLYYDNSESYQFAKFTLSTSNPDGKMKISVNAKIFFGEDESNEFLTYEYLDIDFYILSRQVTIRNNEDDISFIGYLTDGAIEGEWYASLVGKVGRFVALKSGYPQVDDELQLIEPLTGYYQGQLQNLSPKVNLPKRVSLSFVTTQENTNPRRATLHITGSCRFYLGDFDNDEYEEINFSDIQFNFYSRFITAKTKNYNFTFKGFLSAEGHFEGFIYSDGLGKIARIDLNKKDL